MNRRDETDSEVHMRIMEAAYRLEALGLKVNWDFFIWEHGVG